MKKLAVLVRRLHKKRHDTKKPMSVIGLSHHENVSNVVHMKCMCGMLTREMYAIGCLMNCALCAGNRRSAAGHLEALTETIREAHMRELDLPERRLKLEEDQLHFQREQWERHNAEPVFANVPRDRVGHDVPFVYACEEVNAEPDLHVLQPAAMERVLKPHEL